MMILRPVNVAERMRLALVGWLALTLAGCSIASKSDSFGAEGHIRISGGLMEYVLPSIDLGGKVGFFKQYPEGKKVQISLEGLCKEDRLKILEAIYAADEKRDDGSKLSGLDHFL